LALDFVQRGSQEVRPWFVAITAGVEADTAIIVTALPSTGMIGLTLMKSSANLSDELIPPLFQSNALS